MGPPDTKPSKQEAKRDAKGHSLIGCPWTPCIERTERGRQGRREAGRNGKKWPLWVLWARPVGHMLSHTYVISA